MTTNGRRLPREAGGRVTLQLVQKGFQEATRHGELREASREAAHELEYARPRTGTKSVWIRIAGWIVVIISLPATMVMLIIVLVGLGTLSFEPMLFIAAGLFAVSFGCLMAGCWLLAE